jgi:hypothetical protein
MAASDPLPGGQPPDIDISVSATMRRLRFNVVPSTRVRFDGCPDHVAESQTERENLPDRVREGVTYKDVTVRWQASARVAEQTDAEEA